MTPKTIPFAAAFKTKFGKDPAYTGYKHSERSHSICSCVRAVSARRHQDTLRHRSLGR